MIHLFSFYLVLDSVSSQFVSGLGFFGLECDGVDCNKQGYVIRIQKKKGRTSGKVTEREDVIRLQVHSVDKGITNRITILK